MANNQPIDAESLGGSSVSGMSNETQKSESESEFSQTSNQQESEEGEEDTVGYGVDSDGFTIREPAYTTQELVDIILEYYKFLTTIHYNPADLKIPPPGGWTNLTPEVLSGYDKSEYVLGLIRQIPCFDRSKGPAGFLYKSGLLDFSVYTSKDFEEDVDMEGIVDFASVEGQANPRHFFRLAEGRESGGHEVWLNAKDGEITDFEIRGDGADPVDIRTYFQGLKEKYQKLDLFPGEGSVTHDFSDIPESEDAITEEQFLAQGPEVDTFDNVQFGRNLYRKFGWPENFQREACWKEVSRLQAFMGDMEDTDIWEGSPL
ncbi:hypothetical protein F53441_9201 [Fusarium austroafricanum]|uniref:Uncharacterized protein n=1 Tax=Fusarium austroafricanum TaxID=2364996 RepID=A0A8H4NVR5_9HYPO|nr:hypothetical protein F53441_9201 [Fusarium austroafricanum]